MRTTKNKTAIGHLICLITSDCQDETAQNIEIREEETQTENLVQGFHPFDLDDVFVN